MPYKNELELPASVRNNLPEHAQKIYLEAFNNASREETAHKVAWSAVKKSYEKDEKSGIWKKKPEH
jgi:cation transport regulator